MRRRRVAREHHRSRHLPRDVGHVLQVLKSSLRVPSSAIVDALENVRTLYVAHMANVERSLGIGLHNRAQVRLDYIHGERTFSQP